MCWKKGEIGIRRAVAFIAPTDVEIRAVRGQTVIIAMISRQVCLQIYRPKYPVMIGDAEVFAKAGAAVGGNGHINPVQAVVDRVVAAVPPLNAYGAVGGNGHGGK